MKSHRPNVEIARELLQTDHHVLLTLRAKKVEKRVSLARKHGLLTDGAGTKAGGKLTPKARRLLKELGREPVSLYVRNSTW